jgi:hypothetical protein
LAAEIQAKYPAAAVRLVASSGGRFEVTRDEQPIFQKSKLNRHAKPGEILELLVKGENG